VRGGHTATGQGEIIMLKRIGPIVASAICALTLSLLAAPEAHAATIEILVGFQAGPVAQSEVKAGNKRIAEGLMSAFVEAFMSYVIDMDSGRTFWAVYDFPSVQLIASCPEPEYDEWTGSLVFKGKIVDGVLKGAKFSGEVTMDGNGSYAVTQRVQMSGKMKLDVTFSQPLVLFGSGQ
jgi:hypothetical protein